ALSSRKRLSSCFSISVRSSWRLRTSWNCTAAMSYSPRRWLSMALLSISCACDGRPDAGAASSALPDTATGATAVNNGWAAAPATNPATSLIQLPAFALATPSLLLNAPPLSAGREPSGDGAEPIQRVCCSPCDAAPRPARRPLSSCPGRHSFAGRPDVSECYLLKFQD